MTYFSIITHHITTDRYICLSSNLFDITMIIIYTKIQRVVHNIKCNITVREVQIGSFGDLNLRPLVWTVGRPPQSLCWTQTLKLLTHI